MSRTLRVADARRIALASQGFTDPRSKSVTSRQFRRVMDRMSVLQLDSVNVLCRSHYLPVLARLGPYDRSKLDDYLYHSGEHFEYVGHEASITSQDNQPLLRHRMKLSRWRRSTEVESEIPGYHQKVLDEVAERGAVSVKDLSDPGERTGPWWGQSNGKVALEWLYVSGRLSIRERTSMFVTVYDLAERVIRPEVLAQPDVADDDAMKALLMLGAKSHGVGTHRDIADYYRLNIPKSRPLMSELVGDGLLKEVIVEGWADKAYLHPEAVKPRSVDGRALLSPFDPVVWFRPRAERLFGFSYRIEIYVPEPKRVYGYYVLPFLVDGELVGRVDLKADRKAGVLRARGIYAEDDVDKRRVAQELALSLEEMASWLGLSDVAAEKKGNLASLVRQAL